MLLDYIYSYLPSSFFYIKSLILASSYFLVTVKNPIYSILILITIFLFVSFLFIFLGADFLALILIIVYLGAVCVLFLFVIMMLNIKILEIKREINFIPFLFVIISLLVFFFFSDINFGDFFLSSYKEYEPNFMNSIERNSSFFISIHEPIFSFLNKITLNSIIIYFFQLKDEVLDEFSILAYINHENTLTYDWLKQIALSLYTFFSIQFIMAGFVLLLAMFGSIFLTLEVYIYSKRQNLFNQVTRNKGFKKK
jgi:NADH:ubiquinone oxidoreductase subunit 6 (subunit J)